MILYHFVFKNKNARTFARAFLIQYPFAKSAHIMIKKAIYALFFQAFYAAFWESS